MTNGLYTTAVGLVPQMYKQEIISNNLANVNTTGYKKDGILFRRLLDANLFNQLENGDYEFIPSVEDTMTDFLQGAFVSTGNDLDFAIDGKGFFAIQTPDGTAYTRNGNFTINAEGQLSNSAGYPVIGEGGVIEFDENTNNIQITEQGEIFINGVQTNKFVINDFNELQKLKKIGNNLFKPENNLIQANDVESVKIKQGVLEQSNVNAVEEMVQMLITMRRFESLQKSMTFHNETLKKAVNELGRL